VVVGALALVAAGCGDDDDSDSSGGDSGEAAAGDFCSAGEALDVALAQEGDVPAALQDIAASAPEEIQDDVTFLVDTTEEVGEEGDPFEVDGFLDAYGAYADARVVECGYSTVEVAGVDYAFEGVPESIAAGPTAFVFTNEAPEEFHEIGVFRINDDETRSVEEILQLPEEEQMELATPVTFAFAPPGGSFTAFADLESGRYAALCFIPVGGGEDGPPHFTEGMFAEFQVT
jgi:hypothetical protein